MTTQVLRRQIDRAKTDLNVIKPKPPARIAVICEPDPAIKGDSLLDYLLEVREAKKTHHQVFVACFRFDDERIGQTVEGVRYFQSDFAALSAKLALMPSSMGNKNALEDLPVMLTGDVFGPGPGGSLPIGKSQARQTE